MKILNSLLALAFLGISANAYSSAGVTYWSRSDKCEGQPSGEIIVTIQSGKAECKTITIESGNIWAIQIGGHCIDINDESTAQSFCNKYIKD